MYKKILKSEFDPQNQHPFLIFTGTGLSVGSMLFDPEWI